MTPTTRRQFAALAGMVAGAALLRGEAARAADLKGGRLRRMRPRSP